MDNTAGCQLYLGKDALEASITTAKSSEINVLVPGAEPDGDWVCFCPPPQLVGALIGFLDLCSFYFLVQFGLGVAY